MKRNDCLNINYHGSKTHEMISCVRGWRVYSSILSPNAPTPDIVFVLRSLAFQREKGSAY